MFKSAFVLSLAVSSAYGHAFINSVSGANGLSAVGLGVATNGEVARGGTDEQPFQLDTPVLKDTTTDPCGATLLAGSIDIASSMTSTATNGQYPSIPSNGTLTMGVFQVNADGGGPFSAEVSTDATGTSWQTLSVTSQPPGVNGLLHDGPANSSITVEVPSNVTCTGGTNGNACLIRINNGGPDTGSFANGAGPFGGCVAVQQDTTGTASSSAASTSATSTTSKKTKTNKNSKNNREIAGKDLVDLLKKRQEIDSAILAKRQTLTAHMIDELNTATDTAIDIPIDALAGANDEDANGGNSTTGKSGTAVLSTQQAIDLKKAVAEAISNAFHVMASSQVDAGDFGTDEDSVNSANAAAASSLSAGEVTSINAGNAGVGAVNTANVASLLGGLNTALADITGAADATATATATSAAAATTTAASKKGKTKAAAAAAAAGKNKSNNRRMFRFNRLARED
ncbi:uncharacterized protein STEHIDRAFT_122193 [Stereum hirsutum FP-91666 SS1]|uniref:uncharacterized protein n=1 Tax=Stereum hirsutum (strain FP-91666) TaxID=721885 RepID=UPI00044497AD|nr:uncharacterized protein STEHIDRAFT_122193 [Stereum hirsutum FP-91666 SS1]EIM86259.1 hypothetical protein STEHIDRAFT_122193 [Stereum hirsutum FP-91666 SS1]